MVFSYVFSRYLLTHSWDIAFEFRTREEILSSGFYANFKRRVNVASEEKNFMEDIF